MLSLNGFALNCILFSFEPWNYWQILIRLNIDLPQWSVTNITLLIKNISHVTRFVYIFFFAVLAIYEQISANMRPCQSNTACRLLKEKQYGFTIITLVTKVYMFTHIQYMQKSSTQQTYQTHYTQHTQTHSYTPVFPVMSKRRCFSLWLRLYAVCEKMALYNAKHNCPKPFPDHYTSLAVPYRQ